MKDKWFVSLAIVGGIIILVAFLLPVNYEIFKWVVWVFMSICFLRSGYNSYIKTQKIYWPIYFIAMSIILFFVILNKHIF